MGSKAARILHTHGAVEVRAWAEAQGGSLIWVNSQQFTRSFFELKVNPMQRTPFLFEPGQDSAQAECAPELMRTSTDSISASEPGIIITHSVSNGR